MKYSVVTIYISHSVKPRILCIFRVSTDAIKALKQLKIRENNTYKKTKNSRFILGEMSDLDALIKKYRTYDVTIEIVLVQPSLDYSELNSRVESVLGQLACIIKQTLNAETYYIIK